MKIFLASFLLAAIALSSPIPDGEQRFHCRASGKSDLKACCCSKESGCSTAAKSSCCSGKRAQPSAEAPDDDSGEGDQAPASPCGCCDTRFVAHRPKVLIPPTPVENSLSLLGYRFLTAFHPLPHQALALTESRSSLDRPLSERSAGLEVLFQSFLI